MLRHRKPQYVETIKDRHGKERIYFRRAGQARVALPGPLYCEAFWTAYHAAKAGTPKQAGEGTIASGTVKHAVHAFYQSLEYKALAATTQKTYSGTLDRFAAKYGPGKLSGLQPVDINRILETMADRPGAAAHLRKRLHQLFEHSVSIGLMAENPVKKARKVKYRSKGFRTWSEADIAAFREAWPVGTAQRLAMEVLLFTGLRRSDAVRLSWHHLSEDGVITITTQKSGHATEVAFPVHPYLWDLLKECPKDGVPFIRTVYNKARSEKAFTNWIGEASDKAGIAEQASAHGLRKAACRRLAEAGCTPHQIMAITGHRNLEEVMTYTRAVEQKGLAVGAIAALKQ
ncbi:tyrosine-type recombinase/integrase [Aureimonas altamirensis]|uniref:tyrosine-type recombinase/integrase n=1 Tax=Aureimonas altamirensis TaxID=370622 RepID=UPI002555788A|nr:tyrosine-type recombinase/integrase [Aureimonas altamirensis]